MVIWTQRYNRVILQTPLTDNEYYFEVPHDFQLSEVHPDLIRLCELILIPDDKRPYQFTRQQGEEIGLAFSGGADSSAAYCLLRDLNPHLFYVMRDGIPNTMLKHDNARKVFKDNNLNVHCMKTNSEALRKTYGKATGYVADYHVAIPAILLADYYNLGYISTGTMLESTFLLKGYKYRQFDESEHWIYWSSLFKQVGLEMFFPVMPCAEVLTSRIVKVNDFKAESCMRGNGEPCLQCYKCFRKQSLAGIKIEPGQEAIKHLSKRPLKQGASMIYANNKHNLQIPQLKEYEGLDLSWLSDYYAPAIQLAPERFREYLRDELKKYAYEMPDDILSFNIE